MPIYTNPVHADALGDPFVWRDGEVYYAVGTGAADAAGTAVASTSPSVFPLLESRDLVHWRRRGHALVRPSAQLGDTFWAPEVVHAEKRWHLYYSVGFGDRLHQLRVAVSERARGPYVDCAQLTDPAEVAFAIDPHPFRDADGRWYLFHARDFLDLTRDAAGRVRPGTALVVQPLATMTRLEHGTARAVARARYDWQRFAADRPMYGRRFDWHTLEGPCVVTHAGRYYCLYSGGCWHTQSYGVDFVVASRVLGPYVDRGAEAGPRVLRMAPGYALGPGHCSVVVGPDGRTRYIVYHAWGPKLDARRMCIDELHFDTGIPRSPGPTWTPQRITGRAGA